MTLLPHYRSALLEDLKMLRVFDNEKVIDEDPNKPVVPKPQRIKESMVKENLKHSMVPGETMRGSEFPDFSQHKSMISVRKAI